jgi:formylglycine-generating enzyme required for sulfatase activity
MVTLPGYWIGRTPVTVAQFRAFARDDSQVDASRLPDGRDDHPVVGVTWHDAIAYCRRLGERRGLQVTLPSEAEWEKAARGTDGRVYPWGNQKPDERRCNYNRNIGDTTPVGQYSPLGDSPYGCVDMAGNVWEWTRSLYRDYPYDPKDGREDMDAGDDGRRVLRGGAFYFSGRYMRCACRYVAPPYLRDLYLGFRVVCGVPHASGL